MRPDGPTILVVDDDADTRHNLADILGDLGYKVETACDGPTALEMVRKRPYDIALLDFKMPGMDGLTLYRELRKLRAETVAVVVTAFAGPETHDEVMAAGAFQLLRKPVDFPRLLSLVEEALGQPLVLVVDDDPDLCSNLWDLLRDRGYRVALANNLTAAQDSLRAHSFKVVLIDLKLAGEDGSKVFRLVRGTDPDARTVLITGHRAEMQPVIKEVLAEGADAICYKPFDVPTLLTTLQTLTAGRADGSA
jgi:CheY-like chemotaxis protein